MPALASHQSSQSTKLLLIGDSGSGKTGSLASLAAAGYNIRIIDVDNGVDLLANLLRDPKSQYGAEALGRVVFETITDKMKPLATGKLVPVKATVWNRTVKLLDNWKTESEDFGPLTSWGEKDVLVIDSLTNLCTAAMNFVLSMNSRLGQPAQQSDWYTAQQMVESLLQMLYDEQVRCNVIIMCHVVYIGEDNGPQKGYPASLGKALSPKIGRYFNSLLQTRTSGFGASAKRMIYTQSSALLELKSTNPLKVEPSYPIETGLARYFAAVRGGESA